MIQPATLQFLKGLKKNNHKAWFDEHRSAYDAAKQDYIRFLQQVIQQLSKKDASIADIQAKDCLFRINRDVRFSKDKAPYKTNFGAYISKGGRKSTYAGYYFHLEPGGAFCGAGLWMPMPPELARVRQEIDYCHNEFSKILKSASYRKYFTDLYREKDASLSRVPKGYDPENPAAEDLKLKSFFSMHKLKDAALVSTGLITETTRALLAAKPLVDFLNRPLED
jgi:uncharacterized protein (TIGR02453 family)